MLPDHYLESVLNIWAEKKMRTICAISGNSMAPLIEDGDRLTVEHGRVGIAKGDIIVFRALNKICAHRFLGYIQKNGKIFYLMKADAYHRFDKPVAGDAILGKVVQVNGRNGSLALESTRWRLFNCLFSLLSYASAMARTSSAPRWKTMRIVFRLFSIALPAHVSGRILFSRGIMRALNTTPPAKGLTVGKISG